MRRMMLLGVLVVAGVVGITASQDAQPQPNVAEIEKVRDNLFMIKGGGGKTVEETVAGLALPEKFKAYGMGGAKTNVEKIYGELKPAK